MLVIFFFIDWPVLLFLCQYDHDFSRYIASYVVQSSNMQLPEFRELFTGNFRPENYRNSGIPEFRTPPLVKTAKVHNYEVFPKVLLNMVGLNPRHKPANQREGFMRQVQICHCLCFIVYLFILLGA